MKYQLICGLTAICLSLPAQVAFANGAEFDPTKPILGFRCEPDSGFEQAGAFEYRVFVDSERPLGGHESFRLLIERSGREDLWLTGQAMPLMRGDMDEQGNARGNTYVLMIEARNEGHRFRSFQPIVQLDAPNARGDEVEFLVAPSTFSVVAEGRDEAIDFTCSDIRAESDG